MGRQTKRATALSNPTHHGISKHISPEPKTPILLDQIRTPKAPRKGIHWRALKAAREGMEHIPIQFSPEVPQSYESDLPGHFERTKRPTRLWKSASVCNDNLFDMPDLQGCNRSPNCIQSLGHHGVCTPANNDDNVYVECVSRECKKHRGHRGACSTPTNRVGAQRDSAVGDLESFPITPAKSPLVLTSPPHVRTKPRRSPSKKSHGSPIFSALFPDESSQKLSPRQLRHRNRRRATLP